MRHTLSLALLALLALSVQTGCAQPAAQSLAHRVARFVDAGVTDLEPSVALLDTAPPIADATDDFPVRVHFFETPDGLEAFSIDIDPGTSLYGTGEVAGPLLRNGRVIDTWNYDAYGYGDDTLPGVESCLPPLDHNVDRAMICGSPAMLADCCEMLDGVGFEISPRIGVQGDYVIERAFVEK